MRGGDQCAVVEKEVATGNLFFFSPATAVASHPGTVRQDDGADWWMGKRASGIAVNQHQATLKTLLKPQR